MSLRSLLRWTDRRAGETEAEHVLRVHRTVGHGTGVLPRYVVALLARVDELERRVAALEAKQRQ